jgi:hypothetical protein
LRFVNHRHHSPAFVNENRKRDQWMWRIFLNRFWRKSSQRD